MNRSELHPRFIESRLVEALDDSPVVLIQGPRQCGKTTLAQMVCAPELLPGRGGSGVAASRGYSYLSLDDDSVRAGAETDPMGFISDLPERVILDEVQRVPGLFTGLKLEIDRRRVPGRFVLTGSTNVLAVPTVQDSLAGRLETVRLHPLAQCELHASRPAADGFIDTLFGDSFPIRQTARLRNELAERIVSGGYPPALARSAGRRRASWYRSYADAQVQRDIGALSRISGLNALPRLLTLAATQTGRLFNLSRLAAPFQLSRPTIGDYIALLERGVPVGEIAVLAQQSRKTPRQDSEAPHRRHRAGVCAAGRVRTYTTGWTVRCWDSFLKRWYFRSCAVRLHGMSARWSSSITAIRTRWRSTLSWNMEASWLESRSSWVRLSPSPISAACAGYGTFREPVSPAGSYSTTARPASASGTACTLCRFACFGKCRKSQGPVLRRQPCELLEDRSDA